MQEVLGLGEVTQRTKAAGKKNPIPEVQLETIIHVKTSRLG